MGRITRVVHSFNDWPTEWKMEHLSHGETLAQTLQNPWAYTNDKDTIHVRSPAHLRVLGGAGRVWHELWHILTEKDEHHPWWHFCVATKMPARLPYHEGVATKAMAKELHSKGRLDLPGPLAH